MYVVLRVSEGSDVTINIIFLTNSHIYMKPNNIPGKFPGLPVWTYCIVSPHLFEFIMLGLAVKRDADFT